MKILIFGKGRVGNATMSAMQRGVDNEFGWIDPIQHLDVADVNAYDIAIICVPSLTNGPYDHKEVNECLLRLHDEHFKGIVAIRSTLSPEWNGARTFNHLRIVHFPEFMKQHGDHHVNDNPWLVVLGGDRKDTDEMQRALHISGYCTTDKFMHVDFLQSVIIKLGQNGFLATKVTYFNMLYDLCQKYGVDYGPVQCGITADDRINPKHTDVPGWDGKKGYGGHCLPKDSLALAIVTTGCEVMSSVVAFNNRIRNEKIQTK
jgi:UDPglucose 6-dehydrogenase